MLLGLAEWVFGYFGASCIVTQRPLTVTAPVRYVSGGNASSLDVYVYIQPLIPPRTRWDIENVAVHVQFVVGC